MVKVEVKTAEQRLEVAGQQQFRQTVERIRVERNRITLAHQHFKLWVNKPQYLTFVRKIYKLFLTRFLEVPSQGGSSETLSYFAHKSQISRFIYQELDIMAMVIEQRCT